jgi:hypothetical protein
MLHRVVQRCCSLYSANALVQQQKLGDAERAYRKSVTTSSSPSAESFTNHARVLCALSMEHECVHSYTQAVRLAPNNAVVLKEQGISLYR